VAPDRRPGPAHAAQLAAMLDQAEEDVLTYMGFPKKH
jgi:hypothetical protein